MNLPIQLLTVPEDSCEPVKPYVRIRRFTAFNDLQAFSVQQLQINKALVILCNVTSSAYPPSPTLYG